LQIITTDTLDRGLAYAESCFETFRLIDGAIFDWPGHWQRLLAGLAEFGLVLDEGAADDVKAECCKQAIAIASDVLVRITVSGGEATWGLMRKAAQPILHIQVMPYQKSDHTVRLALQHWPFPLHQKKAKFSADYAETLRALRGAKHAHVLFERDGYLLATATANIALYRDGHWCTPTADAGVLPGRVRHFLLQQGLIHAMPCPVSWLDDCAAMVVCNSGVFMQPVATILNADNALYASLSVDHSAIQPLLKTLALEKGVRI